MGSLPTCGCLQFNINMSAAIQKAQCICVIQQNVNVFLKRPGAAKKK